jgi:hypothetical protein
MVMRIGFTGSRYGMSQHQKEQLVIKLFELDFDEFHHGDCIGADSDAHDIIREFFPLVKIHIHPPIEITHRAYKIGDHMYEQYTYLARDKNIVDFTDIMFGAPYTDNEILRSGTWSTIRYARKKHRELIVLER